MSNNTIEICNEKINELSQKNDHSLNNINLIQEIKNITTIIDEYILFNDNFVKNNFRVTFNNYKYMLIMEYLGGNLFLENENSMENAIDIFDLDNQSDKYKNQYLIIRKRICCKLYKLQNMSNKDWDYEIEVLVIIFRLLKFLALNSNRLYLRLDDFECSNVRIFNDYKSNIYRCKSERVFGNYEEYKNIINQVELLKREVEYLNDFVINYYEEDFRNIFRLSKVYYEEDDSKDLFIKGEVGFRASFKIIQKLIGPLYLNKESYGIREMIQNAVDACKKSRNKSEKIIKIEYRAQENNSNPKIIIGDNGIGMDEDTIINKFLTVGESSKEYEKSIGKFGIGILSAFLLADKFKFRTCCEDEEYIYESDDVNLEKVKEDNAYINISKRKRSEEEKISNGTIIEMELKEAIVKNEEIAKNKNEIIQRIRQDIEEFLGLNAIHGKVWHGFSEIKKNIDIDVYKNCYNEIFNKYEENGFFSENNLADFDIRLNEYLKEVETAINQNKDNLDDEKRCNFLEKIKFTFNILSEELEKLNYIDAFVIFKNLSANSWYLLDPEDNIGIVFQSNGYECKTFNNYKISDVITNEKLYKIPTEENEIEIQYSWSDEKRYDGRIICNNMLIPREYEYSCRLVEALRKKPLIFINERNGIKLDIDLSREKCRLISEVRNYEQMILEHILAEQLLNYGNDIKQINELSQLYLKKGNHIIEYIKSKYSIKDKCLKENEGKIKYRLVLQNSNKNEFDIIKSLDDGEDCIYEIVESNLVIDTTFDSRNVNDLYIAAYDEGQVYFKSEEFEKIKKFTTIHLKALILAAYNVYGDVDVYIDNQLRLNANNLKPFKDDKTYLKQLEGISYSNNGNSYCLNYNQHKKIKKLKLNEEIVGVLEFDLDSINYKNILERLALVRYSRRNIWNGFQKGIYETELNPGSRLYDLLTKEYSKNEL